MALTITEVFRQRARGGRKHVVLRITMDASYPLGGWALTRTNTGMDVKVESGFAIANEIGAALMYAIVPAATAPAADTDTDVNLQVLIGYSSGGTGGSEASPNQAGLTGRKVDVHLFGS